MMTIINNDQDHDIDHDEEHHKRYRYYDIYAIVMLKKYLILGQ
jgi:hypothetical protein